MPDDQFTQLTKVIAELQREMRVGFEQTATKTQMDAVYDLLDKNISEHQRQEEERAAMAHQIDRLDGWVHEIATATGVKLSDA